MFNNANKQAKNNAINAAVEAFLANGGEVTILASKDTRKRRKPIMQQQVHEVKEEQDYSDIPNDVRWAMLMQILRENPGAIQVRWNDGRVANSTAELYGL